MGELAPVVEIDGKTIGNGSGGPMAERLGQLFSQLTATEVTPV